MTITTIETAAALRTRASELPLSTPAVESAWRDHRTGNGCSFDLTSMHTAAFASIHAVRTSAVPAINGRDAYVGRKQGRPPRGTPR